MKKQLEFRFMKEEHKAEKLEKIKEFGKEMSKGIGLAVLCSPVVFGIPYAVAYFSSYSP